MAVGVNVMQHADEARTLLETSLSVRKQSGERSAVYAEGLVKMGDLAMRFNHRDEAIDFYTRAVAIGDVPETPIGGRRVADDANALAVESRGGEEPFRSQRDWHAAIISHRN